jgi:IclR family acetate operon transcriptional repressor
VQDLAGRTEETVSLAVLDGDVVLNADQIIEPRSIVSASWVGRPTPYHRTSNGRVLVAFLPEAERERRLSSRLTPETPNTIEEPDILRAQLAEVRARGYAQTVEELEEGVNATATAVRRADGEVIGAVSVAGPGFRMRPAELARDAAAAVSRRLGCVERSQSVGSQ